MPPLTLPNKALKRQSSKESAKQTSDLLNLPWDVRRLTFEKVPTNIWRSIPVGCDGFYYTAKSTEVNLLQVCDQVNAEASYSMQHIQADQPCVLAFSPFQHYGIAQVILEIVNLAHTYDETYTKRVPKDQKPILAISPLAARLVFQTLTNSTSKGVCLHCGRVMPDPPQDEFNTFITQVLLQLRRKPEVELHLYLPKRRMFVLMNQYFDSVILTIAWFVDLAQGRHPHISGTLRYHLTIVSENEETQHALQAKWPPSQIGSPKWKVATEQDKQAWQELDDSFTTDC